MKRREEKDEKMLWVRRRGADLGSYAIRRWKSRIQHHPPPSVSRIPRLSILSGVRCSHNYRRHPLGDSITGPISMTTTRSRYNLFTSDGQRGREEEEQDAPWQPDIICR